MATIRERRPGVWEVRVFTGYGPDGQPTQASRTVRGGKRDANRVAAELTVRPSNTGGRTVRDLVEQWFETNEPRWAEATRRDNRSRMKLLFDDPISRVGVARLSPQEIDKWITRLRKSGLSHAAIRNRHQVVRAALSQAVRWGWVVSNAASATRVAQPKQRVRGAMSAEDVRRVIDAADSFDPAAGLALRLAAVTGARRSELAALRWDEVADDRVTIDSAICTERVGSQEDRQRPILYDSATKTGNRRSVALDPETLAVIESLRAEREPWSPWMFSITERPPNPDRVGNWWRRARHLAGIDPQWRLHDLRHWSATMAIASGHDIRTVAGRLGHSNAAMTLRVYAHAVEAVEAADRGVATTLADALATPKR